MLAGPGRPMDREGGICAKPQQLPALNGLRSGMPQLKCRNTERASNRRHGGQITPHQTYWAVKYRCTVV